MMDSLTFIMVNIILYSLFLNADFFFFLAMIALMGNQKKRDEK